MASNTKQKAKAKAPFTINPECTVLTTKGGPVAVFGSDLVSDKDITILNLILDSIKDHGVRNVIFRCDGLPILDGELIKAVCVPDSGSIVFNLQRMLEVSAKDPEEETSIFGKFHFNLVMDMLHEAHHMQYIGTNGLVISNLSEEEKMELEDAAEAFAAKTLQEMVLVHNLEPAHYTSGVFLRKNLMEEIQANTNDNDVITRQRWMIENNTFVHVPADDKFKEQNVMSFKKLVGLQFKADMNSPEWKTQPPPAEESVLDVQQSMVDYATGDSEHTGEVEYASAEALDETPYTEPFIMNGQVVGQTTVTAPPQSAAAATNNTFPVANAGTTGTAATADQSGHINTPYQNNNISKEVFQQTIFGVFNKIYNHIFTNCGRLLNSDLAFQNPEAVATMTITLTDIEKSVVVKMDCLSENGRWCPKMDTNEGLRGFVMKNAKIPAYKLYVNFNGQEYIRLVLPQNTAPKDGSYSRTALMARAGNCIMYVKDDQSGKFTYKCVDGNWQKC